MRVKISHSHELPFARRHNGALSNALIIIIIIIIIIMHSFDL